jgi:hypothetical protein
VLDVPTYGQVNSVFCGPATAQMMMMGTPGPTQHNMCYEQDRIFEEIRSHSRECCDFFTDPDGLRGALMSLNPPEGGTYSIFHGVEDQKKKVMHAVLYWIAKRRYPAALLTNKGSHWVVVTGFCSDRDPQTGDVGDFTIDINDPFVLPRPQGSFCAGAAADTEGTVRTVNAGDFYQYDWSYPNTYGSVWRDRYVAIVDPPSISAAANARQVLERGRPIGGDAAAEAAARHVAERGLGGRRRFGFILDITPPRAFLVNQDRSGYYLVPFDADNGRSLGAVLVNAYNGDFQEIAAFAQPTRYIDADEAITIARHSAGVGASISAEASLVFRVSEQTSSRYQPLWEVTFPAAPTTTTRYVSQDGLVFSELTDPPLGGL